MTELHFKKSEAQHILKNEGLIDSIIEKAKLKHTDTVLEIGAGTGSITLKLLPRVKKVIAYETDKRLIKELNRKVNAQTELKGKLELKVADALSQEFPHFDVCISNIPFNISLPITIKLMESSFRSSFILVQKEFAERLIAKPGSSQYSRLSVVVQLIAKVEHIVRVSKTSFLPAPKVDTCFIKIEPKIPKPPINVREFDNLLKVCFGRKNKTLSSNLKTVSMQKKIIEVSEFKDSDYTAIIDFVLEKIFLTDARPSKMEIEEFLLLLLEFKKLNINFI